MCSPLVVSDYLYEANNGLEKCKANFILEFGKNRVIFVTALSTIDPGVELFFSYEPDYWADPVRQNNLPARTQQQVK